MKTKYNQYSVVGKVWTICEMFYMGVRDVKPAYILATNRKLEELQSEAENSNAVKEHSFECIIDSVDKVLESCRDNGTVKSFIYDGSVVSTVWFNCLYYNEIKNKAKNETLTKEDVAALNQLLSEISRLWIKDLKAEQLTSLERKDLFTIKKEITAFADKLEMKIKHGNITISE